MKSFRQKPLDYHLKMDTNSEIAIETQDLVSTGVISLLILKGMSEEDLKYIFRKAFMIKT